MTTELFSDAPPSHAEQAIQLVEATLAARGIDVASAQQPEGEKRERRYAMQRGSAVTLIQVSRPGTSLLHLDYGRLRIVAPVVALPAEERQAELFRQLLEENARLNSVAFAITPKEVVLVAERSVQDLDASEVQFMIDNISATADRFDDLLAERYGVPRAADPGEEGDA